MTSLERQIEADSIEAQVDLPSVVTWKGSDYPCLSNTYSNEIVIGPDGNPEEISLKLRLNKSSFTGGEVLQISGAVLPISGELAIFEGVTYKIRRVRLIHNIFLWLDLISINR
jgi:hypothetical protein